MSENEAEDNMSRPRSRTKFRPRGQSGLEDLTSLSFTKLLSLVRLEALIRTRIRRSRRDVELCSLFGFYLGL